MCGCVVCGVLVCVGLGAWSVLLLVGVVGAFVFVVRVLFVWVFLVCVMVVAVTWLLLSLM